MQESPDGAAQVHELGKADSVAAHEQPDDGLRQEFL